MINLDISNIHNGNINECKKTIYIIAHFRFDNVQITYCVLPIKQTINKAGLILGLRPANGRRRYFVTTSFTGWAQA